LGPIQGLAASTVGFDGDYLRGGCLKSDWHLASLLLVCILPLPFPSSLSDLVECLTNLNALVITVGFPLLLWHLVSPFVVAFGSRMTDQRAMGCLSQDSGGQVRHGFSSQNLIPEGSVSVNQFRL
jgi:hypothetical protein